MCGITGYVGHTGASDVLLTALNNLEYRGYDSAGLALQNGRGLEVIKQAGEVSAVTDTAQTIDNNAHLGIGHTRWSTHGPPTDANAHPHTDCSGDIAVVHNGIIDNYDELRAELRDRGHEFTSDTDTEVVPHLVEEHLSEGISHKEAFRRAIDSISGSYAVAMVVSGLDAIFATRSGSPLVVGVGDDGYYLASDVPAFLEFTDEVAYIEDGDMVVLGRDGYHVTDGNGYVVDRPVQTIEWTPEDAGKGQYDHYMLKEIHEQPTALERAIRGRISSGDGRDSGSIETELAGEVIEDVPSVQFVACGTSYHAAMYGEQLLSNRGIEGRTTLASEFVSHPPPLSSDTLVVGVTQSGETADTLEALRTARDAGHRTLAVTNVVGSTAARECDDALFIRAGPEIGVAATKTFSSQVATLALLADLLADERSETQRELEAVPAQVESIIENSRAREIAQKYRDAESYFFVGRGIAHSVALEGALKLKEISYEHAEGFPAGELKHGPLALVTEDTPVFALITGENEDKMHGTIKEVSARDAPVVAVTDDVASFEDVDDHLVIPQTVPELAGILANVQLQLFSYHTATLLDRSVDKPRNLAKSVTVE